MMTKYLHKYFFICLIMCLTPASIQAAVKHDSIRFLDGKLSVNVREASFKDVVKKISEESGICIYIFDDAENNLITTEFSGRSIESGLRSILKEVDYAIVYQGGSGKGNVKWMNDAYQNKNRSNRSTISGRSWNMTRSKASTRKISNSSNSGRTATVSQTGSTSSKGSLTREADDEGLETADSSNNIYNYSSYSGSSTSSDSEASQKESNTVSGSENDSDELSDTEDDSPLDSDEEAYTYESDDRPSWYYEGISQAEGKLRLRIDNLEKKIVSGIAESEYNTWVSIRGKEIVPTPSEQLEDYYNKLDKLLGDN